MLSLQAQFAPKSICFGCGPSNKKGLRIESYVTDDGVVAHWQPSEEHNAFPGVLSGGIIGAILDCHSNWTAAWALREGDAPKTLPCTVTADFHVTLRKPTPMNQTLTLLATAQAIVANKVTVYTTLVVDDTLYAKCTGTFVAVKENHPGFHRF